MRNLLWCGSAYSECIEELKLKQVNNRLESITSVGLDSHLDYILSNSLEWLLRL
jgi:hypothetical protein